MTDLNTLDNAIAGILGTSEDIPGDDAEVPADHARDIDELAKVLQNLGLSLR